MPRGRPKGSKNQPILIPRPKETRKPALTIPKEALAIIRNRAAETGLSPQRVLEDFIAAGDYTMKAVYEPLIKFRKRMQEKAINVVPEPSTETTAAQTNGSIDRGMGGQSGYENYDKPIERVPAGSGDVVERHGLEPTSNPAFGDPSGLGDVIGPAEPQVMEYPDKYEFDRTETEDDDIGPMVEAAPTEEFKEEIPQE